MVLDSLHRRAEIVAALHEVWMQRSEIRQAQTRTEADQRRYLRLYRKREHLLTTMPPLNL